ncbi:MAG: alpha/beta hydrolase [Nevskiales bacterium]|nr:alpha/beta hydrolase [Nevskiales bacterium]
MKSMAYMSPELRCETIGDGARVVVFLHGLGATRRYWKPAVLGLTDVKVVLVDLLGFGDSPKPWRAYTLDRHLESLERTLAPYPRVTLVGHSLGASLATAYAARHRQVEGLVLLAAVRFDGERAAYRNLRHRLGLEGWILTNVLTTALACMLTRWVVARLLPWLIRDLPRPIVQDLVRHTWLSSTSTLWQVIYRYDPGEDLAEVAARIPVQLVHDQNDSTAPYENVQELVARTVGAQLRPAPGGSHHLWLRRPDICLAGIRDCLRKLPSTTAGDAVAVDGATRTPS